MQSWADTANPGADKKKKIWSDNVECEREDTHARLSDSVVYEPYYNIHSHKDLCSLVRSFNLPFIF